MGTATPSPRDSALRSLAITLPQPPGDPQGGPTDLTSWLHGLTESMLPRLLRQADPQHVIEYSLALITVLNEASAGVRTPLICPQWGQWAHTSPCSLAHA